MLRATLRNDPIKLVEVGVKIKHYHHCCQRETGMTSDEPLTATHSMISTYFGRTTMVLKLPLTRAASTNGLQR